MKKLVYCMYRGFALVILFLCGTSISAGGFVMENSSVTATPVHADGAALVGAITFVVVIVIGIIGMALSKRRDRGADDK